MIIFLVFTLDLSMECIISLKIMILSLSFLPRAKVSSKGDIRLGKKDISLAITTLEVIFKTMLQRLIRLYAFVVSWMLPLGIKHIRVILN